MPYFEQELLFESQLRGPLTDVKYLKAREDSIRLSRAEGIDAIIAKHRLDAIVAITNGPAWFIDWVNGDYDTGGLFNPGSSRQISAPQPSPRACIAVCRSDCHSLARHGASPRCCVLHTPTSSSRRLAQSRNFIPRATARDGLKLFLHCANIVK